MPEPRPSRSSFQTYLFIALVAVELLMSFTFLGYLHVQPISITFAYIPPILAGCLLGPVQATVLGAVFGLASLFKASSSYVMPMDQLFSPFRSGAPMASLILSVGTHTLFALLIGLALLWCRKRRHPRLWMILPAALAPKLHAGLVYLAMGTFFPQTGYRWTRVICLDLNDVTISLVCVVLSQLAWHVYHLPAVENFRLYVDQSLHDSQWDRRLYRAWTIFVLMLVAAAAASVIYFAQRIGYMLGQHGLVLTDEMNYDLVHLQIQFLASALSLNLIMALSLMAVYKYLSYREYLGALDGLTGVMGRRMFLNHCQRLQQKGGLTQGWFLFADVDYFKSINDAYGHPAGDQVLIQVARQLEMRFAPYGRVGRMGGDEFAVMVEQPLALDQLTALLDGFLAEINGVLPRQKPVSCSIGVCRFSFPQDVQALYTQTDDVLYAAKHSGRGRYAISDLTDQGLVPLFPAT